MTNAMTTAHNWLVQERDGEGWRDLARFPDISAAYDFCMRQSPAGIAAGRYRIVEAGAEVAS
jgi:hypothetical protein